MPVSLTAASNYGIVRNVRLPDRAGRFDVTMAKGFVSSIAPHDAAAPPVGDMIDGGGDMAVPAFVDGHVHLDKTFIGIEWVSHSGSDTVASRIAAEKYLRSHHQGTLPLRAAKLASRMLQYGTTALRTHVDIDETNRLSSFDTILALREDMREAIDMQIVAFPQSGLRVSATVLGDLEAALLAGADVVGGVDPTAIDGDVDGSLDAIFNLAARHTAGVDLHLHEAGEMGAAVIEGMCRRAIALQLQGKVTVSHGFCLADLSGARLHGLAETMAEAGVALMTSAPGAGELVPVVQLAQRGVRVFAGSDNIRDAWAPSGNGDMLDRARLLAYRADLRTDELLRFAFDCATRFPVEILGFATRGPSVGSQADMVLLPSPSIERAVCDVPVNRRVIRKGRVIAPSQEPGTVSFNPLTGGIRI